MEAAYDIKRWCKMYSSLPMNPKTPIAASSAAASASSVASASACLMCRVRLRAATCNAGRAKSKVSRTPANVCNCCNCGVFLIFTGQQYLDPPGAIHHDTSCSTIHSIIPKNLFSEAFCFKLLVQALNACKCPSTENRRLDTVHPRRPRTAKTHFICSSLLLSRCFSFCNIFRSGCLLIGVPPPHIAVQQFIFTGYHEVSAEKSQSNNSTFWLPVHHVAVATLSIMTHAEKEKTNI